MLVAAIIKADSRLSPNSRFFCCLVSLITGLLLAGEENSGFAQSQYILSSRPSADTAAVQELVESALQHIPTKLSDAVFKNGCRVMIVPTAAEYLGKGYSDRPTGYIDGGGYDNSDGVFVSERNQMIISEKVSYRNSFPHKADRLNFPPINGQ